MIITCPSCRTSYQYDESRFGEVDVKLVKCARCSQVFEVRRPGEGTDVASTQRMVPVPPAAKADEGDATRSRGRAPEETTKQIELNRLATPAEEDLPQLAPLPRDRRYSLAVILGADAGKVFRIEKPRVVLGRGAGCDVQLTDSEVSRRHALLEIRGDEVTIKDLGSTNGTYVEGVRVTQATLESQQEFSLGTTTLMLIITEVRDSELG
ncbi:MAG: FHA domain-containing protein [Thermoanaerobaculum sp.]|nr:FHA domain-containing protein [Thermoanaerobaculum sp.]